MINTPIYLDYNATTPIDPLVLSEMLPYLQTHFGNPSSAHSLGNTTKTAIEKARNQVAALLNCRDNEIIFTSGGTESNNLAIVGAAIANQSKGKHIISSATEHPAVINVCDYLKTQGFKITVLPVNHVGNVDPKTLMQAIRKDTILISIMHANNEVGTIQDIAHLSKIAKNNGILFHTDASQSPGKIECNVQLLGVDLLTIAGHKIYAPKGVGALYIKDGVKLQNILYGANQERGIRPGTENVAQIVALGKACEMAKDDFITNQAHLLKTTYNLLTQLQNKINTPICVNGNIHQKLPNTLSISIANLDAHKLTAQLGNSVLFSTGSACHSGKTEISSVLKAMDISANYAKGTLRLSTGKYTTMEEIESASDIIARAVNALISEK